eukprot:3576940-Pyramimonas_sp.AAC.1
MSCACAVQSRLPSPLMASWEWAQVPAALGQPAQVQASQQMTFPFLSRGACLTERPISLEVSALPAG